MSIAQTDRKEEAGVLYERIAEDICREAERHGVEVTFDVEAGEFDFHGLLLKFHGRPIRKPQRVTYLPAEGYLDWHERQVFKRPPRELRPA